MRSAILALVAAPVLAASAAAQGGMGMQQRQPMPDHWMTWDSLTTALQLTTDEQKAVGPHYEELNAVMKSAANERDKMREMFQSGGSAEDMRSQMMAMREKMDSLQTQVDKHYDAIRMLLTPQQQEQFDKLAKPMVARQRRGR